MQRGPELLLELTSIAMLIIGAMAVVSLFLLRRRDGAPTGYRALGYPVLPATYLVLALFVVVMSISRAVTAVRTAEDTWKAALPLLGIGVFALSFGAHRLVLNRRRFAERLSSDGIGVEGVEPSVGD